MNAVLGELPGSFAGPRAGLPCQPRREVSSRPGEAGTACGELGLFGPRYSCRPAGLGETAKASDIQSISWAIGPSWVNSWI